MDMHTLLTILSMAAMTYLTRTLGFALLRKRTLSPRAQAVLKAVPGCVLVSVIAPAFVSDNPANLIALAITLAAGLRFSLLPTVVIGIVSTGLLRHFLG